MKSTYWALGAAAFLLLGSRLTLPEDSARNTDVIVRMALVMGATLIPAFFVLWWNRKDVRWREFFAVPDPIVLVLSAVAGLAIWPAAWWLMSIGNDWLNDLFGPFTPLTLFLPIAWKDIWTLYVLSEVVFIPLALGILIWGVAQRQLQRTLILGTVFGCVGIMIFGQGVVGFLGYGLCGVIAAITSLRTKSLWAGFATHATFMYANLSLNDELTKQVSDVATLKPKPYLGQEWLTLLLVGGLICLVALQVLRFRTESDTPIKTTQQKNAWVVLLAFLIAASVVGYDEIRQRADREPLQVDLQTTASPD